MVGCRGACGGHGLRGIPGLSEPRNVDRIRKRLPVLSGSQEGLVARIESQSPLDCGGARSVVRLAEAIVLAISIATVIGPTPPGTGVIHPALILALS